MQRSNGFPKISLSSRFKIVVSQTLLVTSTMVLHNLSHLHINSPNCLVSFQPWMSAQTWDTVPFHIFSLPFPPSLCLYMHAHARTRTRTHTALCVAEFTEGLWQGQKQEFISPQHKNLKLSIRHCVLNHPRTLGHTAPTFLASLSQSRSLQIK